MKTRYLVASVYYMCLIKSFHPVYYMRKGPSLEDALEEYKKTLPDSLSEAEYFKACDIFEDNFMPGDSDPDFVEYGEEFDGIDDYLLRYDELLAEYSDSSRYYVAGFFDNKKMGLEDNLMTTDFGKFVNKASELANNGDYLFFKNEETGKTWECDSDKWLEAIELGDVPDGFKALR